METPAKRDATPAHPAGQPVGTPAVAPASLLGDSTHERVFDSLPKTGTVMPAVLYLLLALAAGFLAFFVYSRVRRKS